MTVTDGKGCQATAAYTVTVHPLPTANIAGDNEICLGGHTTLTATGGTSYLWSNGETTNRITVSPRNDRIQCDSALDGMDASDISLHSNSPSATDSQYSWRQTKSALAYRQH
ncbi:MAG: hypothetical protein U0T36_00095 [Saprospiraceae bacterium]